jgi:hypothetical protein
MGVLDGPDHEGAGLDINAPRGLMLVQDDAPGVITVRPKREKGRSGVGVREARVRNTVGYEGQGTSWSCPAAGGPSLMFVGVLSALPVVGRDLGPVSQK